MRLCFNAFVINITILNKFINCKFKKSNLKNKQKLLEIPNLLRHSDRVPLTPPSPPVPHSTPQVPEPLDSLAAPPDLHPLTVLELPLPLGSLSPLKVPEVPKGPAAPGFLGTRFRLGHQSAQRTRVIQPARPDQGFLCLLENRRVRLGQEVRAARCFHCFRCYLK